MAKSSPEFQVPSVLSQLLAQELSPASLQQWYQSLSTLPDQTRSTLIELLQELIGQSKKTASAGLRRWESASMQLSPSELLSWVDLGTALASHSATTAIKYFQDSLPWLGPLSHSQRQAVFKTALDLTDHNYGVVLDFLAACPQALAVLPLDSLDIWLQPGLQLSEADLVLAVEYFRISPALLSLLSAQDLPRWVDLGMRLVVPNQFGKPDYLAAIEYFRLSPEIFSSVMPFELRSTFLELGLKLASHSAPLTLEYIRQGPGIISSLSSPEIRRVVLEHALRLADVRIEVVGDYLKQAPQILAMVNDSISDFENWVKTGHRLLTQSSAQGGSGGLERAKAYFNQRSKTGQETTERLIGGIALSQVARVLKLYAEGLSGRHVLIRSSASGGEDLPRPPDPPHADKAGRAIYLPERIRLFAEPEDNFRFYKVATLHEIGHLEFGTYDLDVSSNLSVYPDPSWAKALWEILEDARIDYLLRTEYPGVHRDMDRVIVFELAHRPSLEGLPPKQAVREALLQLSVTDTTEVPLELATVVSQAYDLLLKMKHPQASASDALAVLKPLYELLDQWLKTLPVSEGETDPLRAHDQNLQEESAQKGSSQSLKMPTTLSYRGTMHPDWVKTVQEVGEGSPLSDPIKTTPSLSNQTLRNETAPLAKPHPGRDTHSEISGERFFFYDEWDGGAEEYRPHWSRLLEKRIPPPPQAASGGDAGGFVQETLARYGSTVKLLRRYFEILKPEAFRKLKRQTDGEEMDLDALIEARIEAKAGRTPSDRVYIKTEKRLRDVAVAFLLDMSGSTSQYIERARKRVIDIEKEGLVLLSEALQAVGDAFGIYAFSGSGKDQVEFYILKEFDEDPRWALSNRIGAIRPLSQNRDGIAIRHAVYKLLEQPARTKLLILLSDGKPLDTDYAGAYALQDTKMALREARMHGIHPYCITIDREASQYVSEMYGEVRYTIIDNVLTLPDRLPQIYRRLTT